MFMDFERKQSGHLAKEFGRICKKKNNFYVFTGTFWGLYSGKKTCNFLPFPDFERKSFRLSTKVSRRLMKIAFNVSTGTFWGVFEKFTFSSSLSHYEKKNKSTFGEKLSLGLSDCYGSQETWWGEFCFGKIIPIFFNFQTLSEVLWDFCPKIFSRVVKSAFYIYRRTFRWLFLGKLKFLYIFFGRYLQKIIQHLAEIFWQACQNSSLGVQGNNPQEQNFRKRKKFFIIFVFWAKTFGTFGKKTSAGLSKMPSTCPLDQLWKFVWKTYTFCMTFRLWVKNCQLFGRKF